MKRLWFGLIVCIGLLAACQKADPSTGIKVGESPTPVKLTSEAGTVKITIEATQPLPTNPPTQLPSPTVSLISTEVRKALLAYYPLDGDATDASGNNYNGSVSGARATQDRFGNSTGALRFDGTNDLIRIPPNPALDLSEDFSIGFWINLPETAPEGFVISKHKDLKNDDGSWSLTLLAPDNGLRLTTAPYSDFSYAQTNRPLKLNQWQCVFVTYKKQDQTWNFYLDNQLNATGISNFQIGPNDLALIIGAGYAHSSGFDHHFKGVLDDVYLFKKALYPHEVKVVCNLSGGMLAEKPQMLITPNCDNGWSQLAIGMKAMVEKGGLPNRVRSEPNVNENNLIAQIYPETIVQVMEGPVCWDGQVFWRVEHPSIPGGSGWTSEGENGVYYLIPYQP